MYKFEDVYEEKKILLKPILKLFRFFRQTLINKTKYIRDALNNRRWLIKLLRVCRFSNSIFTFIKEREYTHTYKYIYTQVRIHHFLLQHFN